MSINRVTACGRLGADPEIRKTQKGDLVASFRLACDEKWKDRNGDWQKRTEWIPVVVWGNGLVETIETYVKKGDQIYVEGKFKTREWEKDGHKNYTTEVVIQGFDGKVEFFFPRKGSDDRDDDRGERRSSGRDDRRGSDSRSSSGGGGSGRGRGGFADELDDEIPFMCEWRG